MADQEINIYEFLLSEEEWTKIISKKVKTNNFEKEHWSIK
jgi:hypothetical protein